MYTLMADEKTSPVMVYTQTTLVHGEAVSKQGVRINTWLRTEAAPEYIHLIHANLINFLGSQVRPSNLAEIFVPTAQVIGFHQMPPVQESLDYDPSEANRKMEPVTVLIGTFKVRGKVRISTQVDIDTGIATSHLTWLSVYEADISNPMLPQMALTVPMLIVRPTHVGFVIDQ